MDDHTLNTFSKEEADLCVRYGNKIVDTKQVEVQGINKVIKEQFSDVGLDVLSVDVEGMDIELLMCMDYDAIRPSVICVETQEHMGFKVKEFDELVRFMESKDYMIHADTMLNTIFADRRAMPPSQ